MFVNKKFMNEELITKITKILCHENLDYTVTAAEVISAAKQHQTNSAVAFHLQS